MDLTTICNENSDNSKLWQFRMGMARFLGLISFLHRAVSMEFGIPSMITQPSQIFGKGLRQCVMCPNLEIRPKAQLCSFCNTLFSEKNLLNRTFKYADPDSPDSNVNRKKLTAAVIASYKRLQEKKKPSLSYFEITCLADDLVLFLFHSSNSVALVEELGNLTLVSKESIADEKESNDFRMSRAKSLPKKTIVLNCDYDPFASRTNSHPNNDVLEDDEDPFAQHSLPWGHALCGDI